MHTPMTLTAHTGGPDFFGLFSTPSSILLEARPQRERPPPPPDRDVARLADPVAGECFVKLVEILHHPRGEGSDDIAEPEPRDVGRAVFGDAHHERRARRAACSRRQPAA